MSRLRQSLERYFEFAQHGATWRVEILAGLTTFVTMAYIIFVNPGILAKTGMPLAAVTAATCLCAAFGSILMGALANYPLALAPGMGLNAYFTYTVVLGMHVPWQTALGAVFFSGVIFLALTCTGIRQRLIAAIPHQLHAAVGAGIGLFIAFIGFRNANIIVPNAAHTVALGNLRSPETALALFGLLLIAVLQVRRIKAAILLGIVGTMLVGALFHQLHYQPQPYTLTAIGQTAFHLDLRGALHIGLFEIVFVFLFVDLFDNLGTLVAVTQRAGLIAPDNSIPRLNRIFFADASATIVGALAGTSTVTSYIESAAGVEAGGRTGVTAIVAGLMFIAALFLTPLIGVIPAYATSPALILVGALMLTNVGQIEWSRPQIAIPAFLTLATIPLTWSIADGLSFGLLSYAALQLFTGKAHLRRDWLLYLLAVLFLLRFIYLAQG